MKSTSSVLESARPGLREIETTLRDPSLAASTLQRLRAEIDPIAERLSQALSSLAPKLAAAKARFDQLGPPPKEGAPAESVDIVRDRATRGAFLSKIADTQKLASGMLVEAEQLAAQISERRRSVFAGTLFGRSYSILAPDLWLQAVQSMPHDLRALEALAREAGARFEDRSSPAVLILLAVILGAGVAIYAVRGSLAPRLVRRNPARNDVPRRRRLIAAAGVFVVEILPASVASFVAYEAITGVDILPVRLVPVAAACLRGLVFLAFIQGIVDAILAPDRPSWRLITLDTASVTRIQTFGLAFGAILALAKVFDALNEAIAAVLPLSIASRAVFSTLAIIVLGEMMRRLSAAETAEEAETAKKADAGSPAESQPRVVETRPGVPGLVRTIGWILIALVLASLLAGYVALGSFLVDQAAWIVSLAALLYLFLALAGEFIGGTLRGDTRVASAVLANTGLRRQSLEQLGVLASGVVQVVLVVVTLMLALAPWGVESGDLTANLRSAFFGFKVGDVTISLSSIALAVLMFATVIVATRIIQRWLDRTFLPTTELDSGLRNSIGTAVGYLGFFVAAAIALSFLGLGLDKIAIVAGALSVGIGFGLQSIVNNFVSGLILLWERPIRVSDLVVVGDNEGYVRRISVRATEIETFDRTSVIIPNSNLISGVVKNRVRGDRSGRVIVHVKVLRNQDPARAAELLVARAKEQSGILAEPPPRVFFKSIGDTWLEFDLICYVGDVTTQLRIQSDLNFAVFKMLVDEGILPPLGPGAMNIGGLDQVQAALQHIADAIVAAEASAASAARDPAPPAGDVPAASGTRREASQP